MSITLKDLRYVISDPHNPVLLYNFWYETSRNSFLATHASLFESTHPVGVVARL